ncbi:MAG: hypothetical protein ACMUIP_09280 [bacterium]
MHNKKVAYIFIILLSMIIFLSAKLSFAALALDFNPVASDNVVITDNGITVIPCTVYDIDVVFKNDRSVEWGLVSFDLLVDISDPLVEGVEITPNPVLVDVQPPPYIDENIMRWGAFDWNNTQAFRDPEVLLGTITLHCLAPGVTEIYARPVEGGNEWFNTDYADIPIWEIAQGTLTINQAVPIPSTILLLLSGICAMVGIKRKS